MSRSYARECAFKLVFEYIFNKEKDDEALSEFLAEDKNKAEVGYISEVYNGVIAHFDEMVADVEKFSKSFKIDRVYKLDLAILLVAIYEMKYIPSIPKKVSMNEALNLSKIYSTEKSYNFINGILANFVGE